jgi:hypothetical protein
VRSHQKVTVSSYSDDFTGLVASSDPLRGFAAQSARLAELLHRRESELVETRSAAGRSHSQAKLVR